MSIKLLISLQKDQENKLDKGKKLYIVDGLIILIQKLITINNGKIKRYKLYSTAMQIQGINGVKLHLTCNNQDLEEEEIIL